MSDLSKEPFWNLKTVLCWIAIRQARDVSLLHLQLERNWDASEETTNSEQLEPLFADAESELIGALGRGHLVATGCECVPLDALATSTTDQAQNDIPSQFWKSAHLDVDGNRATPKKRSLWHWWKFGDIRLDADAVRALWPGNALIPFSCGTVTPPSTQQPEAAPSEFGEPTGPKPGQKSPKDKMCDEAFRLLNSGDFPPKHGRLTLLAKAIRQNFPRYEVDSIRRHIQLAVVQWTERNPGR